MQPARIFALTVLSMVAFAANSILCRVALRGMKIDPASFTTIRLASGAIVLLGISLLRRRRSPIGGSWQSAFALFAYAAAFSLAYLKLSAGTGALLLFAAVQTTMIVWGLFLGERLRLIQWSGILLAAIGLVLLFLPGVSAPPLSGSILMIAAGAAWGIYSLRGRTAVDATRTTAGNFLRTLPITAAFSVALAGSIHLHTTEVVFAIASGAITSALGYIIWYSVLPFLRAAVAATVQLSAPVLAAAGGILLLGESITIRFVAAAAAVLAGIGLVVLGKARPPASARR